jgi:hypothetical protein
MPRSACHMHSELLRKASYVLKTGAGISEQAYSSTEAQPLCSEGQLELPKCFYYLLHWVFDSKGCARLATPNKMDIRIFIQQSADDHEIGIARRCCQESHRTLMDDVLAGF